MDVTGEHEVRFVLLNPASQIDVTEVFLPTPTGRRSVRWCVVDPDPSALRLLRVARELRPDLFLGLRAIPPRPDGEQRVIDCEAVAIGRHPESTHLGHPLSELLTDIAPGIEIMIP